MTYDENKVAIIIPLYNDEANIARAIESAVAQIVPDGSRFEVLIVDDGSRDSGPEIAEDYARRFANVKLLRMVRNGGPSAARNMALRETDAGWFTPFDSDDIMLPERVMRLLAKARDAGVDMVADNLLVSSSLAPETVQRHLWRGKPPGDLPMTAELFLERSKSGGEERSELGFLKPLIRRQFLGRLEAYRDELRFGEDFELYTRMLLDGAKALLTDPEGYILVVREGSASHRQGADDHRKLALVGREFLRRANLSPAEQRALASYTQYCEREWAAWTAIEAVRAKSPLMLLKAFAVSIPASIHVSRNLLAAAAGKFRKPSPKVNDLPASAGGTSTLAGFEKPPFKGFGSGFLRETNPFDYKFADLVMLALQWSQHERRLKMEGFASSANYRISKG